MISKLVIHCIAWFSRQMCLRDRKESLGLDKNYGNFRDLVVDICTSVQQVFNLYTGFYFPESTLNCQTTFLNYTVSQKNVPPNS